MRGVLWIFKTVFKPFCAVADDAGLVVGKSGKINLGKRQNPHLIAHLDNRDIQLSFADKLLDKGGLAELRMNLRNDFIEGSAGFATTE